MLEGHVLYKPEYQAGQERSRARRTEQGAGGELWTSLRHELSSCQDSDPNTGSQEKSRGGLPSPWAFHLSFGCSALKKGVRMRSLASLKGTHSRE